MELHNLKTVEGSLHSGKRVGRGLGSGMGKTSTRGHKGAGARSGGGINPGFEGGQTPIYRRLPKRGFKNINRKEYAIFNIENLKKIPNYNPEIEIVNLDLLMDYGFIKDPKCGLKILGNGEVTSAFTVSAKKISASASSKIQAAGGKVILED